MTMETRRPETICFDLDGTLYQDRVIYPRIISHFFSDTPYASWVPALQSRVEQILAGRDPQLRCGRFVPKQAASHPQTPEDLFAVSSKAALLLPDPTDYFDRTQYTYLSDGWTLSMYLARRIGWEGDAFWTRFRQARADLVSAEFGPVPDGELREILTALRRSGIYLTVCSNAMDGPGWNLLRHLKLDDCFDEVVFDADKPRTFPQRMRNWAVAPERMLFIGDQGYYDLYAGKNAGAATWLISPYDVEDCSLWDRRMYTIEELKKNLLGLLEETDRS